MTHMLHLNNFCVVFPVNMFMYISSFMWYCLVKKMLLLKGVMLFEHVQMCMAVNDYNFVVLFMVVMVVFL